ncbi:MAG: phosphohistidine phosphatase SixA [Pseudomonadota bacterium]
MKIYIMRHGHAEAATGVFNDRERMLSARGRVEAQKVAHWLKENAPPLDGIWSSPFRRALQTAEIVHAILNITSDIKIETDLCVDGCPEQLPSYLLAQSFESILLSSHMPLVSSFVAELVQDTAVAFPTAGLAILECLENESNRLEKFITPSEIL